LSNKHAGGSQLAGIKILELWKNSTFSFVVKWERNALKNLAMSEKHKNHKLPPYINIQQFKCYENKTDRMVFFNVFIF